MQIDKPSMGLPEVHKQLELERTEGDPDNPDMTVFCW